MQKVQSIFIEGIPGSGKSTLAQEIAHVLTYNGIACRWWYEEEKNHPLYVFHDRISLQRTIDDLSAGRYRDVIDAALEKWREFAQEIQSSESIVILDGCLFGYLTWSLFPLDIPAIEIQSYLSQVEQIIQPAHPCLIYLYQQDLAHALKRNCERRGEETRSGLIAPATQSSYGKRQGLQDFDGLVTYWKDFRTLTDAAFSRFGAPKLALENSAGDWMKYERSVLAFLNLPLENVATVSLSSWEHFSGTYSFEEGNMQCNCLILLENDQLIVDGIPLVWQRTRLIPRSRNVFSVESLPFQVVFEEDAQGIITGMRAMGPELLDGMVDHFFIRKQ